MKRLLSFLLMGCVLASLSGCSNSHLDIFPDLEDDSLISEKISPELLKQDIQAFYDGALLRHPHLYRYADRIEIEQKVSKLQSHITEPMTRLEFYKIVGRLSHAFGDGHAFLLWPYPEYQQAQSDGGKPFPFAVNITQNGDVFTKYDYQNGASNKLSAGTQILTINGKPVSELINHMQKYTGGESKYLREQIVAARFERMLWSVYGYINTFSLDLLAEGESKSMSITLEQQWEKADRKVDSNKDFYFKALNSNTGLLHIGHFDIEPDWFEGFIDETFADIKQRKITSLIIDVRENTGGNTDTAQYLATYLASNPFQLISSLEEKLNPENRGFMNYKGDIGDIINTPWKEWVDPQDEAKRFNGNTYLLLGPITYSAGIVFATTLKDNNMATLIGQAPEGNANQTAQGNLFNLPHSQLRAYVTTRMLVRPNGDNTVGKVTPDIEVIPTKESLANHVDIVLNTTLDLIKKRK